MNNKRTFTEQELSDFYQKVADGCTIYYQDNLNVAGPTLASRPNNWSLQKPLLERWVNVDTTGEQYTYKTKEQADRATGVFYATTRCVHLQEVKEV